MKKATAITTLTLLLLTALISCKEQQKLQSVTELVLSKSSSTTPVTFKVAGNILCEGCDEHSLMEVTIWDKNVPLTTPPTPSLIDKPGQFVVQVTASEGHVLIVEVRIKRVTETSSIIQLEGKEEVVVPSAYDEKKEEMPVVEVDIELESPAKGIKPTIHEELPPTEEE